MLVDQTQLLDKSPLGILICDKFMRIIWCNSLFLTQASLNQQQVVNHLFSSLPLEAIDNNGEVVQLFSPEASQPIKFQYWFDHYDIEEGSSIHYFIRERQTNQTNQTSNNLNNINNKINHLKLPKQVGWIDFLDYEVSRSRRYDNPLCILKLHCLIFDNPDQIKDAILQNLIKSTLMDELRWADMIGQTQQDSYILVLPETPNDVVISLKNKLTQAISQQLNNNHHNLNYQLVFAEACWRKHDDSQRLLNRARCHLVEQLEVLLADTKN